ncbi:ATP-grasp domain-containing protein [Streptomyces odontomachi]|uniref:ATP-grasp domain-containing protein n=1 Tax=Streptomyces odontomachi TaxID=2944940 RepID=UPI00210BCAA0|nr:biotin carboxylase [Streptomyces sp. ODS25]
MTAEATGHRHVLIINRWRERYAEYERYIDHRKHAVTYVTTAVAAERVPQTAAGHVIVSATDDARQVDRAAAELAARHGPLTGVIALQENDLLGAARLREAAGLPGPTVEQTLPFRDKALMYDLTGRAGVPQPVHAVVHDAADVVAFAAEHGWPVVIKPRDGCTSAGVAVLHGPEDLPTYPLPLSDLVIQTFDSGTTHHFDGFYDGRRAYGHLSRYINSCFDFRGGTTLGSVDVDSPAAQRAAHETADAVLGALTDAPTVFHLELFGHGDAQHPTFSFLEVGARAGGAEISLVVREVHGADLMALGADLQLGRRVRTPRGNTPGEPVGGWLIIPTPVPRPCRISRVNSLLGSVPTLYAEAGPRVGDIVPEASSFYEHVGGRFRFRGTDTASVERDIDTVTRSYSVSGTKLVAARR